MDLIKVNSPRKGVLRCAVVSRCLVILISALSNYLIPDHAADAFIQPEEEETEILGGFHIFDNIIKTLLGGLVRWDAHYFIHIAKHGYIFENSLAFFPLFPLFIRGFSVFVGFFLQNLLSQSSILLLSATILNFAAFLKAADYLYSISLFVLDDNKLAYLSVLLFCFNPASIFFSAPYSETFFCLFTFGGIYHTFKNNWDIISSIMFGLSAVTRSNGVLNVGFILFKKMKHFCTVIWPTISSQRLIADPWFSLKTTIIWLFSVLLPCIFIVTPFLIFQGYSYYIFCTPQDLNLTHTLMNFAVENSLVLPSLGGKKTRLHNHWCHSQLPLAYSYVQSHYWKVGFFKYFQVAQIPNFLLALPIMFLTLSHGVKFFNQHKQMCLKLGLTGKSLVKSEKTFKMSTNMFVYMMHSVALTVFCFFCIHVQVTTRMIFSASPIPYWVGAYILHEGFCYVERTKQFKEILKGKVNFRDKERISQWKYVNSLDDLWDYISLMKLHLTQSGKLMVAYYFSYFVIGTVLFSNFLPWT